MATEGAQSPLKCDLCDDGLNVPFYCLVCGENMCIACKTIHNKGKATKEHDVVPHDDLDPNQCSSKACNHHPSHIYHLHCEDCEEPVCSKCVTETHKGHNFCEPSDAASNIRDKLNHEVKDMEERVIPAVQNAIEMLRKQSDETEEQIMEAKVRLRAEADLVRRMFVEMIEYYKEMEECLSDIQHNNQIAFYSKEKTMENQLSELLKVQTIFKENINCHNYIELLKFTKTCFNSENLKIIPSPLSITRTSFRPGNIDKKDVQRKLGRLEKYEEQLPFFCSDAVTKQLKLKAPTFTFHPAYETS